MATLRYQLPAHTAAVSVGGVAYEADAQGCVVVPAEHDAECRRHGLVRVGDAGASEPSAETSGDEPTARRRHKRKGEE